MSKVDSSRKRIGPSNQHGAFCIRDHDRRTYRVKLSTLPSTLSTEPAPQHLAPLHHTSSGHGRKPNINHMRLFGIECFYTISMEKSVKLDAKSKKDLLMGYEEGSTNHRVYDPTSRRVFPARDITFNPIDNLEVCVGIPVVTAAEPAPPVVKPTLLVEGSRSCRRARKIRRQARQ